jgi:Ca2+-binding RTX toxin-like protein
LNGGDGDDIVDYEDSSSAVDVDLAAGRATGEGTDSLAGVEAVIGSFFDDTLAGDQSDNAFVGGAGDDLIDGRAGADEAAYFDSRAPVHVDLGAGAATGWGSDGLRSIENVTGSAFDDTLVGDDGPNALVGGSGGDSLAGLGGDDVLVGNAGADSADGGDGADACEAETEVACESDPATRPSARAQRRRGYAAVDLPPPPGPTSRG